MHPVRSAGILPLVFALSTWCWQSVLADNSEAVATVIPVPTPAPETTQEPDARQDNHSRTLQHVAEDEPKKNDFFSFVSRPDLHAPTWDIRHFQADAVAPGYWFIAPYADVQSRDKGQPWVGPYIYDQTGELVWSGTAEFHNFNNHDFRVAQVGGEAMLTVIYEHEMAGVILNSSYQRHRMVRVAETSIEANMHEFNLVNDGKEALVLTGEVAYRNRKGLAHAGYDVEVENYCGLRFEGFKELDVTSDDAYALSTWDQPRFSWQAVDHIALNETTFVRSGYEEFCATAWDVTHSNSLDKFPDGDYLLSARHTDTLYKVSHIDGSIVWRLGGQYSDFVMDKDTLFSRQHHARVFAQNETHALITLFDNSIGTMRDEQPTHAYSRALFLAVQNTPKDLKVEMIAEIPHPHRKRTNSRGSFQILPNGNAFIGWTYGTLMSEHTAEGKLVMEASIRAHLDNYRSYKFEWVGRPAEPIAVVTTTVHDGEKLTTVAYTSWNGATEVVLWRLYKTDEEGKRMIYVTSAQRRGFETALVYDGFAQYTVVEAVDRNGTILGRSGITRTLSTGDQLSPAFVSEAQWLESEADFERAPPDEENVIFLLGFVSCLFFVALAMVLHRLWRYGMLARVLRRPKFSLLLADEEEENEKFGVLMGLA